MTLAEKYDNAYFHATQIPWKIYDRATGRKLCDDYGKEYDGNPYDNMEVYKAEMKVSKKGSKYVRVSVYMP